MAKIESRKIVTPDPAGMEITPSVGYDAMLEVILEAEPNFLPEHIADGIEIWGVVGTAKPRVEPGNGDWPFDPPDDPENPEPGEIPSEGDFDEEAERDDPAVPKEDKFVLADNLGNITTGYLYGDEFEITWYDPVTTEFRAKGWRRVSYHTTGEHADTYTTDDFTTQESGGWNYLKNIRMCTRAALYYNGVEIWPNSQYGRQMMFYNGELCPAPPADWDRAKYQYALSYISNESELYTIFCFYVAEVPFDVQQIAVQSTGKTRYSVKVSSDCRITTWTRFYSPNVQTPWDASLTDFKATKDYEINITTEAGVMWANHDIRIRDDGSLHIAASEPVPAWSYNGVVLPALPEWDKEKYQYAFMYIGVADDNIYFAGLYFAEVPFDATDFEDKKDLIAVSSNCLTEWWICFPRGAEGVSWRLRASNQSAYQNSPYFSSPNADALWANHDIRRRDDGTLVVAASEPVPVYE